MPIKVTRTLLSAALDGSLAQAEMRKDRYFGFEVPVALAGVDSAILNPRGTWADGSAYDAQAGKLVQMFIENFEKFGAHVDPDVKAAAPAVRSAAE
jgi:phosphoenolpyruvate carboxykinase (ATP)